MLHVAFVVYAISSMTSAKHNLSAIAKANVICLTLVMHADKLQFEADFLPGAPVLPCKKVRCMPHSGLDCHLHRGVLCGKNSILPLAFGLHGLLLCVRS